MLSKYDKHLYSYQNNSDNKCYVYRIEKDKKLQDSAFIKAILVICSMATRAVSYKGP